jgi:hypothetical protein
LISYAALCSNAESRRDLLANGQPVEVGLADFHPESGVFEFADETGGNAEIKVVVSERAIVLAL